MFDTMIVQNNKPTSTKKNGKVQQRTTTKPRFYKQGSTLSTSATTLSSWDPSESDDDSFIGTNVRTTVDLDDKTPLLVTDIIANNFPKALKNSELTGSVTKILSKHGYDSESTLLATSLCCDEVNRELENDFNKSYYHHFSMGGLAGFAFGGVTSFGAMSHHIPEDGNCLIVYGPHVGIDKDGNIGKVHRLGRKESGACCGSAAAAASYVSNVHHGRCCKSNYPTDPLDAQQFFVGNMLLPYARRLEESTKPTVELPYALFDAQTELMQRIVQAGCKEVAGDGKIAVLGGIQINCSNGAEDRFLPLSFKIYNNQGQLLEYLLSDLNKQSDKVKVIGAAA